MRTMFNIIAALFVAVFATVVWVFVVSLLRAVHRDDSDVDEQDLYCPHCDSTDLYDWGEDAWWVCHSCRSMFSVVEVSEHNR